jgi:transglutaminase 1
LKTNFKIYSIINNAVLFPIDLQFHDIVLPAIMFLMEKTLFDYNVSADPVKVVRAISAMANSKDDDGLLVLNWRSTHSDEIHPWQWTSTVPILEQYLHSNGQPVKYAQCWVFAAVTTTLCRALGIPARTVTNYASAYDIDDSLTVDKFFSKTGEPISVTRDSIWHYHAWTDCWMAR